MYIYVYVNICINIYKNRLWTWRQRAVALPAIIRSVTSFQMYDLLRLGREATARLTTPPNIAGTWRAKGEWSFFSLSRSLASLSRLSLPCCVSERHQPPDVRRLVASPNTKH